MLLMQEDCVSRVPEFLRDFGFPAKNSSLENEFSMVDGVRWHTRRSPKVDGLPFVLVHGLVISSLYMIPLGECLAQTSEVHAIDLPGFGRSDGPHGAPSIPAMAGLLLKWLDAAGIERCNLVANSMGCQVCADLAARFPARVATLTLIGPTIDSAAHSLIRQALRLAGELVREPPRLWLNHVVDIVRAGPLRIVTMIRQMFRDRIATKLPAISAPTLVMRGANDDIAPPRWTQEVAGLLSKSQHLEFPRAGHCVHYSHPTETARAIFDFVHTRVE